MQAALVIVALAVLIWGYCKLNKPQQKPSELQRYHEEHISPLEKKVASAKARRAESKRARSEAIANAELFTRDFQEEVRQHQEAKREAFDELGPLRNRKSELHDEMEDVRSSLESWHRSSESFFGNQGRKIKDDSIWGWLGLEQTMAQKNNLESNRESISEEILSLKAKMDEIYKNQIKPAKKGIKAVIDDKERLMRFRQDGLNERYFRNKARDLELEIAEINAEIAEIIAEIACLKAAISGATET